MITKEQAEKIILDRIDSERLKRIIRNTSVVAWKKEISDVQIENWMNNFQGMYFKNVEAERKLALWLLSHFSYYTYEDVRILCRNLFNQYVHEKLRNYTGNNLTEAIKEIILYTIFIGLGNDSESGNNILYYFRQENNLSKENFEFEKGKKYENVVYIDDVTISGQQALEYMGLVEAENTYIGMMIATESAINRLTEINNNVKPIATMILDERDRAFSKSSYAFSNKRIADISPIAREFCEEYGKIAIEGCGYMDACPLGFNDGQYMIGFEYNTPDNTLPIFWGTSNNWIPLFKRYQKIYNGKEYALDGRRYY